MSIWFDEHQRPTLVDESHPVDLLEPEDLPVDRGLPDFVTLVEVIGNSYIRGNIEITRAAWKVLLNSESRSMRACAKQLGCTPQAISKRALLLAEQFGLPIPSRRIREMKRTTSSKTKENGRRRQRATQPPAAYDEPLQNNDLPTEDGRPSSYGRGDNDSSDFSIT